MQWSVLLLVLMGQCCCVESHKKYYYIKEKLSWDEAREYCRKNYIDLATVYDMKDVKTLRDTAAIQGEAWIGLSRDPTYEGVWYWSLQREKADELNWFDGEPNDRAKPENCVTIKKIGNEKKMQDQPCWKSFKFICFNEAGQNDAQFYVSTEEMTWWDAQKYCSKNHTDLISGNQQLNQITLTSANDRFWISLFRDRWQWSSTDDFSFRNWAPNTFPGLVWGPGSGDKNCAVTGSNGKWKPAKCDDNKNFFCYNYNMILIKQSMSWDKALEYCREHHNELVSIITPEDQKWVQERAKEATSSHVWLGLRYVHILDFWFWVSNEAVDYENWATNGGEENHDVSGAMERGGQHKWFKKDDEDEFNFICSTL
ncbi:uncharacterized protein V6R79_001818 [Siganus canaliculatus]